jgi:hypothetical protein
MLSEILRSRWFAASVHAGLWLLLILIVSGIGGNHPPYGEAPPNSTAVTVAVPVAQLENLFTSTNRPQLVLDATNLNPFLTSYFLPRTPPPPPPPTTRKIELTYQGFYQTGDSPKRALILFDGTLVGIPLGDSVATNLFVANVTMTNLTLTNSAIVGQSNILVLNTKKELEIPIR